MKKAIILTRKLIARLTICTFISSFYYFKINRNEITRIITVVLCILIIMLLGFYLGLMSNKIAKTIFTTKADRRKWVEYQKKYQHLDAIHEAGHAVVSAVLTPEIEITEVSIKTDYFVNPHTSYARKYKTYWSKEELFYIIVIHYAGKASEEVFLEKCYTGCISDLREASRDAYAMVTKYGFHDTLVSQIGDSNFDTALAEASLKSVENICQKAYEKAKATVIANQETIAKLAKLLEEKETLNSEEIREFMINNDIYS